MSNWESPFLAFSVYGIPAPGGSKNSFVPKRKDGSYVTLPNGAPKVVTIDDAKGNKSWRATVVEAVREQIAPSGELLDGFPLKGPIELAMVFTVKKPKLVPPEYMGRPIVRPDATKYQRSTEDALKDAGLFEDDQQVWNHRRTSKVYPGTDEMALPLPGAVIYVWRTRPVTVTNLSTMEGVLW